MTTRRGFLLALAGFVLLVVGYYLQGRADGAGPTWLLITLGFIAFFGGLVLAGIGFLRDPTRRS